ncbi:MAG: hypothetical protein MR913_12485 [Clostridiales bacterium]|nr:hypothetical protein [Clostridiales bacterium]
MNKSYSLQETFAPNSSYRVFLACVLITGLSSGLYKGILDNYLAEIVRMSEMDRGVTEFFREMTGILLVFILAVCYMFSAETMFKSGALIILLGLGIHSVISPGRNLTILAISVVAMGEHIQLGMKSTLSLQYAVPGHGGAAQGIQNSVSQIGTLIGFLSVAFFFSLPSKEQPYRLFFALAAVLATFSFVASLKMRGSSETDKSKRRFYFRRKYNRYYMLEMFYGARKQVFLTFGPYVLILFYGANTATISLLFAISAAACIFAAPLVGKIIDWAGYKTVMVADTLILVVVCFFYGFAHHIFPRDIAFVVCCVNYVLDAVISLASMASNNYVQELSDGPDETKAAISTGVSINHVITIFIALFGGWIWQTLGIETLFMVSAALGLLNSAYAATIQAHPAQKESAEC